MAKKEISYKQGNTMVWTDGDKLVIKNPAGPSHVKANIEQIFGMGEYEKIREHEYFYNVTRNKVNKYSTSVEIVSPYIPQRVINDLKLDEEDQLSVEQIKKYFKDML